LRWLRDRRRYGGNPEAKFFFGTSLIRGEPLREGRLGIVNLYGGLSPDYRGADCTFWALYNDEPHKGDACCTGSTPASTPTSSSRMSARRRSGCVTGCSSGWIWARG